MKNPRKTHTNAADSAPGVDDGPARGAGPPVDSRPRGRSIVMLLVAAFILILILVWIARPEGRSRDDPGAAVAPDVAGQAR